MAPEDGGFPTGVGTPRLKEKSCQDLHVKDRMRSALWACVVKFETFAMPAVVAVHDGTEVVAAFPGRFPGVFKFRPR